jgi:hypothetical protein
MFYNILFAYFKFYSLVYGMCLIVEFLAYYISLQVVVNMIFVHFKLFFPCAGNYKFWF